MTGLFLSDTLTFSSILSARRIAEILAANTLEAQMPDRRSFFPAPDSPATDRPFCGRVSDTEFCLVSSDWRACSRGFTPVFRGSFEESGAGTRVRVRVHFFPWVVCFLNVWQGAALAFFLLAVLFWLFERASALFPLVGALLLAAGVLLPRGLLFRFSKRPRKTLTRLICQ